VPTHNRVSFAGTQAHSIQHESRSPRSRDERRIAGRS
jgi:hypothetical protein